MTAATDCQAREAPVAGVSNGARARIIGGHVWGGASSREIGGRSSLLVFHVESRASGGEELDDPLRPAQGCIVHRRHAGVVGRVDVRAFFEQQPQYIDRIQRFSRPRM